MVRNHRSSRWSSVIGRSSGGKIHRGDRKGIYAENCEQVAAHWMPRRSYSMHEITTRCREKINCTGRFMDDAGNLYKALFDLGDVKMWDLIEGVWVYMVCFSV
jgi:hypothetical protein